MDEPCIIPVNRIAALCGVHHSTLQRKVRERLRFEIATVEIEGIPIGQPLMMVSVEDAKRLVRVYNKWADHKASDEITSLIQQLQEQYGDSYTTRKVARSA